MAKIASALDTSIPGVGGLDGRLNLTAYGIILPNAADVAFQSFVDLTSTDTVTDGADGFTSGFDQFEILDRGVSGDFADDSAGSDAGDDFGILQTGDFDAFFGAVDIDNGQNPGGTGTARWVFDISGASQLDSVSIDVASIGDFEEGDNRYDIVATIDGGDGGADIPLFSIDADNDGSLTYTFEGGTTNTIPDPLQELGADGTLGGGDDTILSNEFTTLTSTALAGLSGSELTIELRAGPNNGGSEIFALRNLVVEGTEAGPAFVLDESFDDADGFTTSTPFFSDDGSDFFGISDGAGGGDFGTGDPAQTDVKGYTGADGRFLTGEDLDGEGASLPVTVLWDDLDISSLSNLQFEGDFAEFFDDPGDIDADDFILVEYSIDDGGFQNLIAFEGADFTSSGGDFNGVFRQDTDFDGEGDGTALGNAFQTFSAAIAGVGSLLDLRLSLRVEAGDEDFAVDNFRIFEGEAPTEPVFSIAATDAVKAEGASGEVTDFTFTVTRSGNTEGAESVAFFVASDDADAADFEDAVLPAGLVEFEDGDETQTITIRVAGDDDPETDEDFTVTLTEQSAGDLGTATATGTILNDDVETVLISEVQGALDFVPTPDNPLPTVGIDDRSPLEGVTVTVEAIVTADFQSPPNDTPNNDLSGFFLMEEADDQDADPLTSEGIFIFDDFADGNPDVEVGDIVQVTGTVGERFGNTQITADTITVISEDNPLPDATDVTFPTVRALSDGEGGFVPDLEFVEGMLVTVPEALTVTELFNLDRFNEYRVSSEGRLTQFTQTNAPDAAGFEAFLQDIATRSLVIDDARSGQNLEPIEVIDGNDGELTADDSFRMVDTISNLTGVVNYSFSEFRVQDPTGDFEQLNPRPEAPAVEGGLEVVSFNVQNFFATLDDGSTIANGLDPRGADNAAELERQTAKLVEAITELDADILGLVELENDFGEDSPGNAIQLLVDEVNTALGEDVYDWIRPGADQVGTDAISVGIIYDTTSVSQVGTAAFKVFDEVSAETTFDLAEVLNQVVPDARDQVGDFQRNRPVVAASFEDENGEVVTVAVNHFKSKGDSNLEDVVEIAQAALDGGNTTITQADIDALIADPNYDQGDGQAFWNQVRTDAAAETLTFVASNPTGVEESDILLIGDLNAYAEEDPVTTIEAGSFTDLAEAFIGNDEAYSFVFDGQKGTLDYGFASNSLLDQVAGVEEWHINADEPDVFDYNLDFDRPADLFTGSEPFRNSDHDPLVIGLDLETPGDEIVFGTPGNDLFLSGTDGDDVIDGLGGRYDRVSGGIGTDTFVVTSLLFDGQNETLVITDFTPGETLRGISADEVTAFSSFFGNDLLLSTNIGSDNNLIVLRDIESIEQVNFEGDPFAIG